jgi:CRP/FNR family transcriptional regulator, cyclic AMP receptor protein
MQAIVLLIWQDHSQKARIHFEITQEDLPRMIGATRETVSHCLSRLHDEGPIVRGRAPFVVDKAKLEEFLAISE